MNTIQKLKSVSFLIPLGFCLIGFSFMFSFHPLVYVAYFIIAIGAVSFGNLLVKLINHGNK